MKIRNILLMALVWVSQAGYTQRDSSVDVSISRQEPVVSGLHTLSIHVKDTLSQDSVTRFLRETLGLPVYYTPVTIGKRRYSGLYAGNLVLEPCGPYPNIKYASDDFRSIFFGVNFEVFNSLKSGEMALQDLGAEHQVNKGSIYIKDSLLCSENLFAALYEVYDTERRDSLRQFLRQGQCNNPGIEYIKEIVIGYKKEINYQRWKSFLHPIEIDEHGLWPLNDSLSLRFVKESVNQVNSITFKVKSLTQAIPFLRDNNLLESNSEGYATLNRLYTYGLLIHLSEIR